MTGTRDTMELRNRAAIGLLLSAFVAVSGCGEPNRPEQRRLEWNFPIGTLATDLEANLREGGYTLTRPIVLAPMNDFRISKPRKGDRDYAFDAKRFTLGNVKPASPPPSEPTCMQRPYSTFISAGANIICWVSDNDDKIIWREAGYVGTSL